MYSCYFTERPAINSPNGTRATAVDDSSVAMVLFTITEDVPLVRDEAVTRSFVRYDGASSNSFNFSKSGSELMFEIGPVDIYEHEGNYSVSASNPAGDFRTTVYLDVQSQWPQLALASTASYVASYGRGVTKRQRQREHFLLAIFCIAIAPL